jgi:hypothetical protein
MRHVTAGSSGRVFCAWAVTSTNNLHSRSSFPFNVTVFFSALVLSFCIVVEKKFRQRRIQGKRLASVPNHYLFSIFE